MARLAPKLEVLRSLFAHSGNQCAFECCSQVLINHKNQFVGQICHIEAANQGGERFNPSSTDEERRSYDNLLLLCYQHHIETNDINEFTVEKLKVIKQKHENNFKGKPFNVEEEQLLIISKEMNKYWEEIERLNKIEHIYQDSGLAMEVSGKSGFLEIIANARESVAGIENMLNHLQESDEKLEQDFNSLLQKRDVDPNIFDDVKYYENPFINRNWELHNLGTPNWTQRIKIDLLHAEIKYLEEYLKNNKGGESIKTYFEELKNKLKEYAQAAMHVD